MANKKRLITIVMKDGKRFTFESNGNFSYVVEHFRKTAKSDDTFLDADDCYINVLEIAYMFEEDIEEL